MIGCGYPIIGKLKSSGTTKKNIRGDPEKLFRHSYIYFLLLGARLENNLYGMGAKLPKYPKLYIHGSRKFQSSGVT